MTRGAPLLVGIVNVTPDSFSDGGRFIDPDVAVRHGLQLLEAGADWLDIGGESTRPGAAQVDERAERQRVVPVIERLHEARPDVVLSIDTSKARVAAAALEAGATVVNDVTALSDPEMGPLCAHAGASVILMHMRGRPETMQKRTDYTDLVGEVCAHLQERVRLARSSGIPAERIWVDPGVGFGKAPADNPQLIAATGRLRDLTGCRVLIGASRKRFIGDLTGVVSAAERVHGSVGAALAAAEAGADALRVHDVAATRQALTVYRACRGLP